MGEAQLNRVSRFALALSLAVGAVAALAIPAVALTPPTVRQTIQDTVPKPNGIAYDPYQGAIFVTSVGPPPRLYKFGEDDFLLDGSIDLPADADPGAVDFGTDGYLYVIDHAGDRVFRIDPFDGRIVGTITEPANVQFITDYITTFSAGPFLMDFGDSFSAGEIWYGLGFGQELKMPDTITPQGSEILVENQRAIERSVSNSILGLDAENNKLFKVSDDSPPQFLGEIPGLPGTPGIQPPRGLSVNPLNLNPTVGGQPVYPIIVAFPDLGLYESLGPNGPWSQIPATGIGRPAQVSGDCTTIGTTSFSQNLVTFFRQDEPKGSHCEEFMELLVNGLNGNALKGSLESYVDGAAKVKASLGGGGKKQSFAAVQAKSKRKSLRLTAGRLTAFKVSVPRAVVARVRSRGKAIMTLKIRVSSQAGESAKVVRRVRIRRR